LKPTQSPDWKQRRPFLMALMWALIPSLVAFLIAPIFADV